MRGWWIGWPDEGPAVSVGRARAGALEFALACATLIMFAEAFIPRILAPDQTSQVEIESTFLRYLWIPFYGLVLGGLLLAGRRAFNALSGATMLLGLALLAMASTAWSIDPDLSLRRGAALLATTLLGIYLAARFDWITALRLLGGVWLALMAASLISGLLTPGFGVMSETHPGAWSGGWWEKNQLGGHAARATFLFAFLAWRDDAHRRLWGFALVIALALVVLSTSATALLGVLLGLGVLAGASWMLRGKRHGVVLMWAGLSAVGVLAMVYVAAPGVLLGLIGRDATLTGRTDIWAELMRAISERPWLGHGYMAFWAPDSEPRYWLAQAVDWNAPSGHNGWLDLAISLGLVGVLVFAIDLTIALFRAVGQVVDSPVGVFAAGFIAQFLLFAMSESLIAQQNSILWASYVFVSAKLAMDAAERRRVRAGSAPHILRDPLVPTKARTQV